MNGQNRGQNRGAYDPYDPYGRRRPGQQNTGRAPSGQDRNRKVRPVNTQPSGMRRPPISQSGNPNMRRREASQNRSTDSRADRYVGRGSSPVRSSAAQNPVRSGSYAPYGRAAASEGIGYRPKYQKKKSFAKPLIIIGIIALILAVIFIAASSGSSEQVEKKPEKAKDPIETNTAETEEEPKNTDGAEGGKASYASRNADTKDLSGELDCKHAILIDLETNTIIGEKGGDERIYPASMTKMMTALVAIEHCDNLDDTFVMTNEIIAPLFEADASVAGFAPGEAVTVRDMLYGTILPSGADATKGLAEYVAGSEEAFAVLMNEKCEELGLRGTHFVNSSGLHDDNHYSTPHDIALILEAAMANETLAEILGTADYTTSKTPEHPDGIPLMDTMYYRVDGAEEFDNKIRIIGGKTGFTGEAGNCLASIAEVASTGRKYIFVCAGGDTRWKPIFDTIHVYRNYLGEHYDGEFVPKNQR